MGLKDSLRDCTEFCRSTQHGDFLGAALILREPTDKELASSLSLLCGNLGSLVDSAGRTILHLAASVGRRDFAHWLVKRYNANLNAQDKESGYTPLHRSIFYGQLNVAAVLTQMGADLSIQDNNFLSPIELAMKDRLPQLTFSREVPCEIYVWGTNTNFNLGTDSMQGRQQPEVLDYFRKMKRIVSIVETHMEKFHTVMVSACGRVWACGHGQGGRLGVGSERTVLSPVQLQLGSVSKSSLQNCNCTPGQAEVCIAAAVGRDHTLLLMESYSVLVFGLNTHHVLGLNPPPLKVLEPQRLSMNYVECLKGPPLGVCAGRFHSVIWSSKEILTFGLNGGQLGHQKCTEKTVVLPKPVNALFYKDVEITHVAASDGATIVATGNRHIWVLHEYQRSKLPMRYSMEIEQVAVVGGHLGPDLDPHTLADKGQPLKVAAISREGSVFLWQEKDLLMTRCILSSSRQLKIVNIHLNQSHLPMLLVSDDGEAFSGEIRPCRKKATELKTLRARRSPFSSPNTDGECHVVYKQQTEKSHIKEFLDPDVCYAVCLQRIPNAHRSVKITSDPKGRNFSLVQTHPSVFLSDVPELPPVKQGLRKDMANMLAEANEFDTIHDLVFEVGSRKYPAHQFIVSRHSNVLLHMIHEAKKRQGETRVPIIKVTDLSPDLFYHLLQYMYTGESALTNPSLFLKMMQEGERIPGFCMEDGVNFEPHSLKKTTTSQKPGVIKGKSSQVESDKDIVNPLGLAKAAAKKLGLMKLVSLLNHLKYENNAISWIDPKKSYSDKPDFLCLKWSETLELCDVRIISKDGASFNVHKCMLAARSEYFHNMLAGGWIESQGTRDLPLPLDHSILSILLDYIYSDVTPSLDNISLVEFDLAMHALIAADLFLIDPFKMRCEAALASLLTLRNVKVLIELALTYNAPHLRDCCFQFVCLNLSSSLETGVLCGLSPSALDGLRDYYRSFHPRMQCRVMTPFSWGPTADFLKEIAASNPILWDEEMDFENPDEIENPKKSAPTTKKRPRQRRISENQKLRHHMDSFSSDDMDTSFDSEVLDWNAIVEKDDAEINRSMEKVSLEAAKDVEEKERKSQWIKVLTSSKAHKTVQARLKAAATVRKEALESSYTSQEHSRNTSSSVHPYLPIEQSPPHQTDQPIPSFVPLSKSTPVKVVAPGNLETHFPQLGSGDRTRASQKFCEIQLSSVEKRLSKLSQKQRKRLTSEEGNSPSLSSPVPARGWEQREEVVTGTPSTLSLFDIMQEQLQRSKQSSSKPIPIKRLSVVSSSHTPPDFVSPWKQADLAVGPVISPSVPSVASSSPSADTLDPAVKFSDIMADEMQQRENWTRMRAKPLNLTQIEDKAIDDLISFYNANEACEERITVRRVVCSKVAKPVWVTSKH